MLAIGLTYVPFSLGLSLNKTYARSRFFPGVTPGVAGGILIVPRHYMYLRVDLSGSVDTDYVYYAESGLSIV